MVELCLSYARPWALPQYWKQVNRPIAWFLPEDCLLWEECNGASVFPIGRDATTKLVLTNQPCAAWTCSRWTKWVGPVPWRHLGHQATGHSGKPCSPINCVSQENWSLAVVAPFSIAASGFLSEVKRASLEDYFSEIIHFFLQFQELTVTEGLCIVIQWTRWQCFWLCSCAALYMELCPVEMPAGTLLWICLFTLCRAIFLVIFSDYVMSYQLDITE